jgi:molecular chaperone DnaK (HSP70)
VGRAGQVLLAGGTAANVKLQGVITSLFESKPVRVDTFPDETAAVGAAIEGARACVHTAHMGPSCQCA